MTTAPTSPVLKPGSHLLWETWHDAATEKLACADRMRQLSRCDCDNRDAATVNTLYGDALDWFREAVRQAEGFAGENHHKLCLSKAGVAWAEFQRGNTESANTCACAVLDCLKPHRPQIGDSAQLGLARARCRHILGAVCAKQQKPAEALKWIAGALTDYAASGVNTTDVADMYELDGDLKHGSCRFQSAADSYELSFQIYRTITQDEGNETFPRGQVRQLELLARAADSLSADGQARQAELRYLHWQKLYADVRTSEFVDPVRIAEQGLVFLWILVGLGHFEPAQKQWQLLDCDLQCVDPVPDNVAAELASVKAEASRQQGQYKCAMEEVACLDHLSVTDALIEVRSHRVGGLLSLDIGNYEAARAFFAVAEKALPNVAPQRQIEQLRLWLGQVAVDNEQSQLLRSSRCAEQIFRCLEDDQRAAQPELGLALSALTRGFLMGNKSDEAVPVALRARQLITMVLGPHHPEQINVLLSLAELAWAHGDIEDGPGLIDRESSDGTDAAMIPGGLSRCAELDSLLTTHFPQHYFAFARVNVLRGRLLHLKGCYHAAESTYRCAINCWNRGEQEIAAEHPEKGWTLLGLATLYVTMGHDDEARELYNSIAVLLLKMKGSRNAMAYEFNRQGNLYYELSLFEPAEWLYLHAEALYQAEYGQSHAYTKQAHENRAKAAAKIRQRETSGTSQPGSVSGGKS